MIEACSANILQRIFLHKLSEVEKAKTSASMKNLRKAAADMPPPRGFARAVRYGRGEEEERSPRAELAVIAELKKASPSAGVIREDFDPASLARSYQAGGAAAISCLTDQKFFMGSLENLRRAREAVSLPILRKEFMIDPWQVWEARAAGADAILLIAGFVPWGRLHALREVAHEAGLDVLLEIHSIEELAPALELHPEVLGINNRNLRDEKFVTDLSATEKIAPLVPSRQTLISESGIRTREDAERLARLGIDGILVGEHLMREPDPGEAIKELRVTNYKG